MTPAKVRIILGVVALGLSSAARADMCAWIDKKVAQKAVETLKSAGKYLDYCELCDGAKPEEKPVKSAAMRAVEGGKYFEVTVNDQAIDLAYAFVPSKEGKNKWRNLGKASGCPTSGVSALMTFPKEANENSWNGTYQGKNVKLILEQPSAGPWHHIQLAIGSSDNGNDRIEVEAQADMDGDRIRFKTPLGKCDFIVQKKNAKALTVKAATVCGPFGTTISGDYRKP